MNASSSLLQRPVFWLGSGLFLITIALLIGGLVFGWQTPDAGFMQYCPPEHQIHIESTGTGEVFYIYTGDGPNDINGDEACSKPASVGMAKADVPLQVAVISPEVEEDVLKAMAVFNRSVGCSLFTFAFANDPKLAPIVVRKGATQADDGSIHLGGTTSHTMFNGEWRATVVVHNLVLASEIQRAIMHELGHVVGLAHDDFKHSLMYSGTSGSAFLTYEDQELLQGRYCP